MRMIAFVLLGCALAHAGDEDIDIKVVNRNNVIHINQNVVKLPEGRLSIEDIKSHSSS